MIATRSPVPATSAPSPPTHGVRCVGRWIAAAGTALVGAALIVAHRYVAGLSPAQATPLAALDGCYTLVVVATLLLLAWSLGRRLLRPLRLPWRTTLEESSFCLAIGCGAISYATFALALAGLLYTWLLIAVAIVVALAVRDDLARSFALLGAFWRRVRAGRSWAAAPAPLIVAFGLAFGAILLSIALMPPFLYDALWYHLAVPQCFVEQHRFVVLPQVSQASFPFTVEMLYAVGLLLGTDSASAVLEFACGIGLLVATWSCARRWFGPRVAWIAVAALLTASEVQKLAAVADIDLVLTLFQFLALYAALVWLDDRRPGWLAVCAVLAGLAAGSKYTALAALAPLAALALTADGLAWRRLLKNSRPALLLVAGALLVAAPWYLKNLIVVHNPVYPLLATLPPNPLSAAVAPQAASAAPPHSILSLLLLPLRVLQSGSYLSLTGRGLGDYLQLPFQVFARGDLDMYGRPSLLFVFAPLALCVVRRGIVARLAFVALAESIVWALGPQELRYLVPTFPIYAVLGAVGLDWLVTHVGSPGLTGFRLVLPIAALLGITLYEDGYLYQSVDPIPVLAGLTSRDAFLGREVSNYNADKFLATALLPGQRVLAFGEVRSYYSRLPIIFDNARDMTTTVFGTPGSPEAVATLLQRNSIAYLLMEDIGTVDQAPAAPAVAQREQQNFQQFAARYLTPVFDNADVRVYRFTPPETAP